MWRGGIASLASAIVAVLLLASATAVSAQGVAPEYRLKAAFVAKFPEFTEWPKSVMDGRNSADLCIAAPTPFGPSLLEAVAGDVLQGRSVRVREIRTIGDVEPCMSLFLPRDSLIDARVLLKAVAKFPLLTIGETADFLDAGGMIAFSTVAGRIRFAINLDAARQVGLRFSSQLLRLATNVRGEAQ